MKESDFFNSWQHGLSMFNISTCKTSIQMDNLLCKYQLALLSAGRTVSLMEIKQNVNADNLAGQAKKYIEAPQRAEI